MAVLTGGELIVSWIYMYM